MGLFTKVAAFGRHPQYKEIRNFFFACLYFAGRDAEAYLHAPVFSNISIHALKLIGRKTYYCNI
jgi:hypothetical protein